MAPKPKNKDTNTPTDSKALGINPEALLSYLQQQQIKKDDSWKPSIVNFQPNGQPVVQTQLAGSYSFNTVAPQYIAPGYEHLRDLSIKKDLEGQQEYSKWDKVRQTIGETDITPLHPTYGKVMNGINTAMSEHDSNLRQGRWSDNGGLIADFTNDLVKNKGLGDVMSTIKTVGEAKDVIKAKGDEYDPITQTGGIPPEERAYYNANPGTYKEAQFDKNNNYIGGIGFTPATIYETRNIPKEVQDATDKILASSYKDANGVYQLGNMAAEWGIDINKKVTAEEVSQIVASHIYANGGREYLDHKAKVSVYNKYNGLDANDPAQLDMIKKLATKMAEDKNDPSSAMMKEALTKGDSFLSANAMNILGIKESNDLEQLIFKGAIARSAFEEVSTHYGTDTEYIARLNDSLKAEKEAKTDNINYSLVPGAAQIVVKVDSSTPDYISNQQNELTSRAGILETQLKAYSKEFGSNSSQDAKYRQMSQERADIERKLEDLKLYSEAAVKPFENTFTSLGKSLTQTAIAYNQGADKTMTTKQFKLQFLKGVQLFIEGKNDGEVLASTGLKSSVDLKGKNAMYAGNFKGSYVARVEGIGEDQRVVDNRDAGNIIGLMKATADKWKKDNPGKENPDALYDAAIITGIIGDTTTTPAGRGFNNHLASNKELSKNIANFVVSESQSNKKLGIYDEISENTGVDIQDIQRVIKPDSTNLYAANIQTGLARKEGRSMFIWKAEINETSKDAENAKILDKIRKVYPNGINIPVMLTPSVEKIHLEGMKDSYYNVYNEIKNSKTKPGLQFENTLNNLALGFGVASNIAPQIDNANLYGLDGRGLNAPTLKNGLLASQRAVIIDGNELIITAKDDPGSGTKWDKSFTVAVKKDGQSYIYWDNAKTGERTLMTQEEKNSKGDPENWVQHGFDTDTDVKAFIARGYMDTIASKQSFNNGGVGQSGNNRPFQGWDRSSSKTYKTTVNYYGKPVVQNTYIPQDKLKSLEGSGIKIKSTVGLPYVHTDVYNNVVNTMKSNDLTLTGGMRTIEHNAPGGAEDSKHYLGVTVDIANDAKGKAFTAKLKNNPKLKQELGISWDDVHDKGTGLHLHLEFAPQSSKQITQTKGSAINMTANKVMNAIAGIESNNKNIGDHYKNKDANSSAFGKFGFTDYWFPKMAKHYGLPIETIKARPDLIEEYAKTEYFNTALGEINPYFDKLKVKMRTFISDFKMEDAIMIYHYGGEDYIKGIVNGTRSPNEIPRQDKGNKKSIRQYIQEHKKYM